MTTVNCVLGPVDTADLGFTLMHEHLINSSAGIPQNYPELLRRGFMERVPNFMDRIVTALTQAKEEGIDTIVDATTFDMGRDVTLLAEASRLSGVNIITNTGWGLELPNWHSTVSADQFAELFVREIQKGIAGTDIKAGILKAASDYQGVMPGEETILRAVARAHFQTNVPIMLHSCPLRQVGKQQLPILREEGVDLRRVKVDHSNDTADLEYLTWLLEQGCYLGLDRYPGYNLSPVGRTKTMKALIDAGHANHLLLSHDWGVVRVSELFPQKKERRNPFLYIEKVVFPQLREMGVPETTLNSLCVDGPRSFFEGV